MHDPIDWGMVIESPLIWGSALTFLAAIITQWVVYRKHQDDLRAEIDAKEAELEAKKEESGLAAIQATVEILRAEVERLSGDVKELRIEMEENRKKYRILTEKYSTAIAYIGTLLALAAGLFSRLDAAGVDHGEVPSVPHLIAEDMPGN